MEDVGQKMTELMEKYHWEEKVRSVYKEVLKSPEIVAFIKEHHDELDADEIRRSMPKFIEYLSFKKDSDAGKKTFMPGYCPKLIMSSKHIQIVYLPTKENLRQKQQRKIKQRVRAISVPKSIKNASLQEYGTMTKGRAAALKQALLWKIQTNFTRDCILKENLALERRIFWEQSQTIWQKTAFQQQSCTSRHSSLILRRFLAIKQLAGRLRTPLTKSKMLQC